MNGQAERSSREGAGLPPVQMALLDDETLDQLFFDVAASAELLEVRVKAASAEHATGGSLGLGDARTALVSGGALGVQLRYSYRGAEWLDTLLRVERGVELV